MSFRTSKLYQQPPVKPALVLEQTLRGQGYEPGVPPCLTEIARRADEILCRTMKCPTCKVRGMEYHPYRRSHPFRQGGSSYRALAVCPRCQAAEEV